MAKKKSINDFYEMKKRGKSLMITAYDFPMPHLLNRPA